MARSGTRVPNAAPMRVAARVAASESPPRTKKLASTAGSSILNVSAKIPRMTPCANVRAVAESVSVSARAGEVNAATSTLPLAVNGIRSTRVMAAGTIVRGRRPNSHRAASCSPNPTTHARILFSRTTTTAPLTSGCNRSADSMSPSSIRTPRICTCASRRPR
ncbi:unannotated protein [freshwater metagenome]|uniref:Unannotated protein n=1 Tax=freshwater metagenome TaxID=449393 RepID=A0A6J7HUM1_9ZZZZ